MTESGGFVGKPKTDDRGLGAEQVFDIELFEKEYFESLGNDPEYMANEFEFHYWKYIDPVNARGRAHIELISAKQKIRELQEEIAKQEAIINTSNRTIQKQKRQVQAEKSNKRGRPKRSECREQIVRKFMMKWVASLMVALEVKSCGATGGLENKVSLTTERNWRRWLKGDAIPSCSTFDNLLNSKITDGKYAGEPLYKVPVTPTHNQILTLLRFI